MASRVLKRGVSCQGEGQWLKYGFARVNLPIYALAFSDDVFEKRQYATCLHAYMRNLPEHLLRSR